MHRLTLMQDNMKNTKIVEEDLHAWYVKTAYNKGSVSKELGNENHTKKGMNISINHETN